MGTAPSSLPSSLRFTAGVLTSAGLGLLFYLVTARTLGPSGYGAFAAALTYATLWAIAMEARISVALTREAAAHGTRLAWVPRVARWKRGLGLVGIAGALACGALFRVGEELLLLIGILALGMLGLTGMRLASAVLRVAGRFGRDALLAALQRLLLLVFAIAVLFAGTGALGTALAVLLSYWITGAIALSLAGADVEGAAAQPSAPPPGFLLRVCAPIFGVGLLTGIYFKVDRIILLDLRGAAQTGLYAAAYRVIEALLLLVGGAMGVLFHRMASARDDLPAFSARFARAGRGRPVAKALLALVVSVGLWEGLSPWPLRHLGAVALGGAR